MKVATRKAKAEESFTSSLVVDEPPREVFDAINDVRICEMPAR